MGTPQIIMIVLMTIVVVIASLKHGEPKGFYSIWATLVAVALEAGLLYWGGFFG